MPNEVSSLDRVTPASAPKPRLTFTDLVAKHAELSGPLIVGACAYVYILVQHQGLLGDPDTYWHIAAGRWMIEHRAIGNHISLDDAALSAEHRLTPRWTLAGRQRDCASAMTIHAPVLMAALRIWCVGTALHTNPD